MDRELNLRELNSVKRMTDFMTLILLSAINMADSKEQHELDNGFKWEDRYGNLHKPKEMSTRHLLYTWLMIWNHSVPHSFTIWFSNHYEFMDQYTNEYMQMAFGAIYREIKRRFDYGPKWADTIESIENFIQKHPELEEIKIK